MLILTGDENGLLKRVNLGKKEYDFHGESNRQNGILGLQLLNSKHVLVLKKNGKVELYSICTSTLQALLSVTSGLAECSGILVTTHSDLGCSDLNSNDKSPIIICYSTTGNVKTFSIKNSSDDYNENTSLVERQSFQVQGPIQAASVINDGVAFGGIENDLQLYDINTGASAWKAKNVPLDKLHLRVPVWITAVKFLHPNEDSVHHGAKIITGTGYKQIRIYDTRTSQQPIHSYDIGQFRVTSLMPSFDGTKVFVGDTSGGLNLWDLRLGRKVSTLKGSVGSIRDLHLSPQGDKLISISLDRMMCVYNTTTNKLVEKQYLKSRLNCCVVCVDNTISNGNLGGVNQHDDDGDNVEEYDDIEEYKDDIDNDLNSNEEGDLECDDFEGLSGNTVDIIDDEDDEQDQFDGEGEDVNLFQSTEDGDDGVGEVRYTKKGSIKRARSSDGFSSVSGMGTSKVNKTKATSASYNQKMMPRSGQVGKSNKMPRKDNTKQKRR